MQYTLKTITSVGAALAASPLLRSVLSNYYAFHPLSALGLERRQSRVLERVALVGLGAAVGAGAALIFAPSSGEETRRKLTAQAEKVSNEAKKAGEKALGYLEEVSSQTAAAVGAKPAVGTRVQPHQG
jgi:YtxH-like protein